MTLVSIDEVVRGICGTEYRGRFADLSNQILKDLDHDQIAALVSAHALDGNAGALALLAVWLKGERVWVRIRPTSKRVNHVMEGITFRAGRWFSVPKHLGERCRDEPESDMGKYQALFEVESQAPKLDTDERVEWVW